MSEIRQQNDWAEFREHLTHEIDRQATSNKTLLWVGIAVLAFANIFTALIAVNARTATYILSSENVQIRDRLAEMQAKYELAQARYEDAKSTYEKAKRLSRR